jgi:hypothetical protein
MLLSRAGRVWASTGQEHRLWGEVAWNWKPAPLVTDSVTVDMMVTLPVAQFSYLWEVNANRNHSRGPLWRLRDIMHELARKTVMVCKHPDGKKRTWWSWETWPAGKASAGWLRPEASWPSRGWGALSEIVLFALWACTLGQEVLKPTECSSSWALFLCATSHQSPTTHQVTWIF